MQEVQVVLVLVVPLGVVYHHLLLEAVLHHQEME
jgi:hypothetical protein